MAQLETVAAAGITPEHLEGEIGRFEANASRAIGPFVALVLFCGGEFKFQW